MTSSKEQIKEFIESTKLARDTKRDLEYDVIRIANKTILREKIKGDLKGGTVFVREWENPKRKGKRTNKSRQEIINRLKISSRQEKLNIDKIKSSNTSLIKIYTRIPRLYIITILVGILLVFLAVFFIS